MKSEAQNSKLETRNSKLLEQLIRPHLKSIVPYSSARDDFKGVAQIFLDANENPFNNGLNRYPDPHQTALKSKISELKDISTNQIFIGNGSDEAIDLLFRAFCEPGKDNVIIMPPTYGMYKVSATINNVQTKEVVLDEFFDIDVDRTINSIDSNTKLIFFCSPNNPTGNVLNARSIEKILLKFKGLVIVDEAYIDFADLSSWLTRLNEYPNLVVLQTLSKAWGLAALRLGLSFAQSAIIEVLNKIKPPYNISEVNQQQALEALGKANEKSISVEKIVAQRKWLEAELNKLLKIVLAIYPSQANFLLVKVIDANKIYKYLMDRGIVVRNRSKEPGCENCLRITVGTEIDNKELIKALQDYEKENTFS